MINITLYRIEDKQFWKGQPKAAFRREARWHSEGRKVIYTSRLASLAVLEWLKGFISSNVEVSGLYDRHFVLWHADFLLNEPLAEIDPSALSSDWWRVPAWKSRDTQQLGNKWIDEKRSLILRVPSSAVPSGMGWNYLIDPEHTDFDRALQQSTVAETHFNFQHYLG
ncbi:MAG: RES family NAD+ phosphorylase [Candidatus Competibacteraceae bacterium]